MQEEIEDNSNRDCGTDRRWQMAHPMAVGQIQDPRRGTTGGSRQAEVLSLVEFSGPARDR